MITIGLVSLDYLIDFLFILNLTSVKKKERELRRGEDEERPTAAAVAVGRAKGMKRHNNCTMETMPEQEGDDADIVGRRWNLGFDTLIRVSEYSKISFLVFLEI